MIKYEVNKSFNGNDSVGNIIIKTPETIFITDFENQSISFFKKKFDDCLETGQDIIPIYIDSPGGLVTSVFGMIDIIKMSPVPVATIGLGRCASAGSLLLTAGTEGYRFASENAEIMIHQISGGYIGTNNDMQNYSRMMKKTNTKLLSTYDKNCNKPKGTFQKLIEENRYTDKYLTAKKALKLNIINHIGVPIFKHIVDSRFVIENTNEK